MPINPDAVGAQGDEAEFSWASKDSLLYALGVGAGVLDPTGFELEFTTENSIGVKQKALPTQVVVMGGAAGAKGPDFGDFELANLVHGAQAITLHQPLQPEGRGRGSSRVKAIWDKGKAAVVVLEGSTVDAATGAPLWSTETSMFIRGEGGWGRDRGPSNEPFDPGRPADHVVSYQTRPDQALLYRLNGDRNPLHADPQFAQMAGFPKPILHGLCTFGFTGRALLHTLCGSDPARFKHMGVRFSSPVMPGDQLDVHIWVSGSTANFITKVGDTTVIDGGILQFD